MPKSHAPHISVIVPVYNAEKHIHRCIDSILSQSFTNFELLLIDDGSSDQSGEISDKYAATDSRIRVFHKDNGGVSSARNIGLDNARGEWITFCDADDSVMEDWLDNFNLDSCNADLSCQGLKSTKQLSLENHNPDLLYGIDFNGKPEDGLQALYENNIIGYLFIKAFRSSILEEHQIRFDAKMRYKEDEDFILRYCQYCNSISCTSKCGYMYYAPDWDKKYKLSFDEQSHLLTCLCKDACNLKFDESSSFLRAKIEDATDFFVTEFKCKRHRMDCLHQLRTLIKVCYNQSRIFKPTKFVIAHDPTYILSYIVLLLQTKIKNII